MRIQSNDPDSDISFHPRSVREYQKSYRKNLIKTRLRESVPVLIVLVLPFSVHAGFFTSLAQLMSGPEAQASLTETTNHAATDTPLLSATQNPDPKAATGGGDVTVTDGVLVSSGPVGEDEIAASDYRTGEIRVYTVKSDDTLSQIADMYGVTTNTIIWANDLKSSTDIHAGDTLVILPIVGVKHTVKEGESLSKIVEKYDADLAEVLDYNNLASAGAIAAGDELMIPGGEIAIPKSVAVASGGSGGSTNFSHPVPGAIRTQGIHGYNGVDLAAAYGTAIRAAAAGEVIVSKSGGWNGGYGNYIVIKHASGAQTLYAHLSSNSVSVGQWVSAGQTIGAMGNSGRSTGTHLHFEVRGGYNPF